MADKMMRVAGRDDNGKARPIKVNEKGELQTDSKGIVVISSEQTKPRVATEGKALLESDTGKMFYYDGAEWREFV